MSGGVDSSVAAALLTHAGYDVYGVFMQGWQNPHFECTWKDDRHDAARVAAHLGIPFRTLDFSREYHDRVVSYLIREYTHGRTPNPDVMCNKEIKFGLFFNWAMREGADYIATGHYVRKSKIKNQKSEINPKLPTTNYKLSTIHYQLQTAIDSNKDQTYFLWTLTPNVIARTLFPIGEYTKSQVRELAREFGLPTAEKKDSQGICFVGKGSIVDFLKEYIPGRPGIVETTDGNVVGRHDGVEYCTIGQRHGIGVHGGSGPYYVAEKDMSAGTIRVAEHSTDPLLYKKETHYCDANWLIDVSDVSMPFTCEARIRYRAPLERCTVFDGHVVFDNPVRAIAPGQSIVFYRDGVVLGGGIIA